MKAAFFIALVAATAFTGHAIAADMMGMTIAEFVAWGWRI